MFGFECGTCAMQAIAAVVILRVVKDIVGGMYAKLLRAPKDLTKYGKWAIVTGATDGIGKAIAFELAKKGMSLVLISRTQSNLDAVKEEINKAHSSVEIHTVAADLSTITEDVKKRIASAVSGLDVGVLVNNVGVSYPFPKYYHELTDDEASKLVDLNITATNVMTRLVLPAMVEKKKGCIVNMSSFAGLMPSPLLAGYNGAKCGVTSMTQSLAAEYGPKGIHFQAQVPLFVATKLAKVRNASLTTPSPATFAKSSVAAFGYEVVSSPYWAHAALTYIAQCLPSFIVTPQTLSMHLGIRKRGIAKEARLAAEKK
eukprot:TRINITY_DN30790_c0_g1_i1.p1 TRINITY_DN30790_c0_g1~~TRINITY_DN30790_c0_g1_i1.p1  ORF type:complete len:314 (+),score=84.91 TRINITY_DN30790_c0_g1_i1:58-999(+)